MRILEQFEKNYLDDLLPRIFWHCCGGLCTECFYGGKRILNSPEEVPCPIRHIVAEKLGLKPEDIGTPSSWGYHHDELLPSIEELKVAKIKDPERVKSLVVRR